MRLRVGLRARRTLLTCHIVAGVGLLGSVAGVLAINIRAAATTDTQLAASSHELLAMLTLAFGAVTRRAKQRGTSPTEDFQ